MRTKLETLQRGLVEQSIEPGDVFLFKRRDGGRYGVGVRVVSKRYETDLSVSYRVEPTGKDGRQRTGYIREEYLLERYTRYSSLPRTVIHSERRVGHGTA